MKAVTVCLDIICPRWSVNLAHYAALMSWCISWPQIRRAENLLCACMCWGPVGRRDGSGWKIFVISFLRTVQRLVSILSLDLVQNEGIIGRVSEVIQVGYVDVLKGLVLPRLRVSVRLAFKQLLTEAFLFSLERESWKHYSTSIPPSWGLNPGLCTCWVNALLVSCILSPRALLLLGTGSYVAQFGLELTV